MKMELEQADEQQRLIEVERKEGLRLREIRCRLEEKWKQCVETFFTDEGRRLLPARALNDMLERVGEVPLGHIVLKFPELCKATDVIPLSEVELARVLRTSPKLEIVPVVGGPPFFVRPGGPIARQYVHSRLYKCSSALDMESRIEALNSKPAHELIMDAKAANIPTDVIKAAEEDSQDTKTFLVDILLRKDFDYNAPLVVMEFNVSADGLCQMRFGEGPIVCHGGYDRRSTAPRCALDFPRRSELVLCEIRSASPDVICLQEANHFESFWEPQLHTLGYNGFFAPRFHESYDDEDARPPFYYSGRPSDGCAILLKRGLGFRLDSTTSKRFTDLIPRHKTGKRGGSKTLPSDEDANRDSGIVQVAYVVHEESGRKLLTVSTAYLRRGATDEDAHMRKTQVEAWIELVEGFQTEQLQAQQSAIVLCGDLGEDGPICGDLASDLYDDLAVAADCKPKERPPGSSPLAARLCKALSLQSAYHAALQGGTTAFIEERVGIDDTPLLPDEDDGIKNVMRASASWQSSCCLLVSRPLVPTRVWNFPSTLQPHGLLLSLRYPSHALSLAARLLLRTKDEEEKSDAL